MSLINKKLITNVTNNKKESTDTNKHFPVSSREWNNSVYAFNKYALNLIPIASLSASKLINSYFSLFNYKIEKKLRTRKLPLRFKRLSKNKIFIGNNEFKHMNSKVVVDLYLFNRQSKNYDVILKKRFQNWKRRKHSRNDFHVTKLKRYNKLFLTKIKYLLLTLNLLVKKHKKDTLVIIQGTKNISEEQVHNILEISENSFTRLYNKLRRKIIKKLQLYFYYKQLKFINKSKFDYTFLQYLREKLEILFNKDIEFNLINLKRFYLSSDILSETIKLKLTKNRRAIFRHLNKLKNKVKIQKKPLFIFDNLDMEQYGGKILMRNNIVENIKYKDVTGFRVEASGRLTRRHTASRSVTKVKYKGNLLNIDSSYRGLSTVLLKGNLEDNLQYTKMRSKTRIGSFGLKGWVSGN